MNDRDAHPDDPSRGRVDRGYDYDPLTDPIPSQPRPRGRRARPEPDPRSEQFDADGRPQPRRAAGDPRTQGDRRVPGDPRTPEDPLGPGAPPPGRRRRPGPPAEPPRRGGAADALRGGRAARSATGRPQGPDAGRAQPPADPHPQQPGAAAPRRGAADPTQDALAALADLGGQTAPATPSSPAEEPPRRGRRRAAEPPQDEPEAPSPLWGEDDGPMPSFLADEPEEERRPRRGRRKREAPAQPPAARRGRRRAAEPPQEEPEAPAESFDAPATGPTPVVDEPRGGRRRRARQEEPDTPPTAEEPSGRRRRRRASRGAAPDPAVEETGFLADVPADTAALAALGSRPEAPSDPGHGYDEDRAGGFADDSAPYEDYDGYDDTVEAGEEPPADEEPAGRRGRRRRGRGDEEPAGRRRRRGGRRAAAAADPVEDQFDEPVDAGEDDGYDGYEEPNLNDIAEAYGGSRRKRKQLKQAQKNKRAGGAKARKRRGRRMTAAAAVVLVIVVGAGGYGAFRYLMPADYSGEGTGEVVFVIENGQSGAAVGEALVDAGVVASVRAFTAALSDAEDEGGLEPGTYSLAENMSGESAVAALLDDANRLGGRVTVPEGLRARAVEDGDGVLQTLSEQLAIPVADLEEAYGNADLGLPEYATQGPEGYLFPETYRFDPGADPGGVLRTMVTEFRRVAQEIDLEQRAEDLGYDANEVMAIASIVQAESGREEDMANISAVVHNRLNQGMPLQMDSTCFYALGTHGLALTEEEQIACENDPGEYGTYGRAGLPAGPFVAPGQSAIEAALEPADVDYLYFALINPETGETGFSRTLDEHNQMVAEYSDSW